jgi:hypothetical protein
MVSIGTSENLSYYEPPHVYSLPFGKKPEDIVEIGIAGDDRVYTWFNDSTVSVGTSTDLDKHQPRHPYRIPSFKSVSNIVGIDIACSTDHVYVWYSTGQISSGTSEDLDKYIAVRAAAFRNPTGVVGIGIAGNDHVYAWYNDRTASSGTSTNLITYREKYDYVTGPGPCDIRAEPPKFANRSVFGIGFRGPTCKSSDGIAVRLVTAGQVRRVLAEKYLNGRNFELPLTYQCTGHGGRTLFTEVTTTNRTVRSAVTEITDCF